MFHVPGNNRAKTNETPPTSSEYDATELTKQGYQDGN